MSSRLNPGPLIRGVLTGLHHRDPGKEKPDQLTRRTLVLLPLGTGVASGIINFSLDAGDLIAAFALLAGVLLAAFTQLTSWRSQLSARMATYGSIEEPARRSIDEAVAHTLWAALLSAFATLLAIGADTTQNLDFAFEIIPRTLTGCVVAVGFYLILTFVIIVNLLWDGYTRSKNIEHEEQESLQQPPL